VHAEIHSSNRLRVVVEVQAAMKSHDGGRDLLKWIAVVTMTLDHIGLILYPEALILRIIGRVSFPLFSYLLVLGMESTHDPKGYLLRMIGFAFLSQIPFAIANEISLLQDLNIFFTLSLGIICIYFHARNNLFYIIPIVASLIIPVDYGIYGLAMIFILYEMRSFKRTGLALFIALNLISLPFELSIQPFALLALPLIILHNEGRLNFTFFKKETKFSFLTRYLFYVYYPIHLLLLSFIRTIR
jgi:hypothetical protein